jgi:hypothetical protein
MRYIIKFVLTFFLIHAGSVQAHVDTLFQHNGDSLVGLPEEYQPATFSYETRELIIGINSVVVPESIWNEFGDVSESSLTFSGSWYHGVRKNLLGNKIFSLPSYISIENSNLDLLINLDTLELIERSWKTELTKDQVNEWNSSVIWGDGYYPKKSSGVVIPALLIPIVTLLTSLAFIIKLFKKGHQDIRKQSRIVSHKKLWFSIKTVTCCLFIPLLLFSAFSGTYIPLLVSIGVYPVLGACLISFTEKTNDLVHWRRKAIFRIGAVIILQGILNYYVLNNFIIWSPG